MKPVILFGMSRDIGGACTESADVALLWRSLGFSVTVISEGPGIPNNPWPERLAYAGCVIKPEIAPENLSQHPWLSGSIVVDFACKRAAQSWDQLARMGCKLAHLPCHSVTLPHEYAAFRHRPPTAVVFQSAYQKSCLTLQYSFYGVPEDRQYLIHGAFDTAVFPFNPRPHCPNEPFVIGRLSRPVPAKFPPSLFDAVDAARTRGVKCKLRLMGWGPLCGVAPDWAECLPERAETAAHFLSQCHAIICHNHRIMDENWPRVGLEAMASGVPIAADARGGWCEMIEHERTGLLCASETEYADAIVRLARNEGFRQQIARNARESLGTLADPVRIGREWKAVFSALEKF